MHCSKTGLRLLTLLLLVTSSAFAQPNPVSPAINQLGLDLARLQRSSSEGANLLLSPYSIEAALAMAYLGADGATRDEMQRVLHLPADDAAMTGGFAALAKNLGDLQAASRKRAEQQREYGGSMAPIEINVANRLFAQSGFALRPAFTNALREQFDAPLEEMDFIHAADPSRAKINAWIAQQTHDRIRDLIPAGGLDSKTRAVLANAIYLKAAWAEPFRVENTKSEPFWAGGKTRVEVPTMLRHDDYGYAKRDGFAAITLPYVGGELQFLILLPDGRDGADALGRSLTGEMLSACARLPQREIILRLPKFKVEPPLMPLGETLRALGMKSAFDQPPGSANFDRMAPRKPDEYLYISEVFHKTWLALDEKGTEAAAATAVAMAATSAMPAPKPPPLDVRVDHPFFFAIQHVSSGACLFLGRLGDPR